MNLATSLRAEILKSKRTASWYITIAGAAILPLLFLLDICIDGVEPATLKDPLNIFYREGFRALSLMILPMFIILTCTLLPQIEYRNNTWKQVFSSPQSMANIFISKFLNVHLMIIAFLLLFNICMALSAVAINFITPQLKFLSRPFDVYHLLVNNVNTYVAVLAISAIQLWFGLRFKNFIVPIALGFILWMLACIMVFEMHSTFSNLFPFTYPVMTSFYPDKGQFNTIYWCSPGYAILFLALGFIDFRQRKMRA